MNTKYLAITASAAVCVLLATPLLQAEDQKDKIEKAKRLEEGIRQTEPPVASTTTKKSQAGEPASVFRPPQKPLTIKAPPAPVVTAPKAPAKAPPTVSTSTTTVSSSTSTATAPQSATKKTEPD